MIRVEGKGERAVLARNWRRHAIFRNDWGEYAPGIRPWSEGGGGGRQRRCRTINNHSD